MLSKRRKEQIGEIVGALILMPLLTALVIVGVIAGIVTVLGLWPVVLQQNDWMDQHPVYHPADFHFSAYSSPDDALALLDEQKEELEKIAEIIHRHPDFFYRVDLGALGYGHFMDPFTAYAEGYFTKEEADAIVSFWVPKTGLRQIKHDNDTLDYSDGPWSVEFVFYVEPKPFEYGTVAILKYLSSSNIDMQKNYALSRYVGRNTITSYRCTPTQYEHWYLIQNYPSLSDREYALSEEVTQTLTDHADEITTMAQLLLEKRGFLVVERFAEPDEIMDCDEPYRTYDSPLFSDRERRDVVVGWNALCPRNVRPYGTKAVSFWMRLKQEGFCGLFYFDTEPTAVPDTITTIWCNNGEQRTYTLQPTDVPHWYLAMPE